MAKRAPNVSLWTGLFGLAIVGLLLVEFPFRVALGTPPLLEDTAACADYVTRTSGSMLTIIVIDMFRMACVLIFLAGFRHLIREARADFEWVGTLVFGTGPRFGRGYLGCRLDEGRHGPGHGRRQGRSLERRHLTAL